MKKVKYALLIFVVFINTQSLCGQNQSEPLKLKSFSFGEYYYADFSLYPSKINHLDPKYSSIGIYDKNNLFYSKNCRFKSNNLRKLIESDEIQRLRLEKSTIEQICPTDTIKCSFEILNSKINWFEGIAGSEWLKMVYFGGDTIKEDIYLNKSNFKKSVTFKSNKCSGVYLHSNIFYERFGFNFNTVNGWIGFENTEFKKKILFLGNKITGGCRIVECTLPDTVDFSGTIFNLELSLINSDTDSMDAIILENVNYPNGELNIDWDDIKGKEKPRIGLDIRNKTTNEVTYIRLEKIYKKLRDNYLKQGKKESALAVMYELEWQKEIIFGELNQIIYGKLFGYGYRPLLAIRFMLIIVFLFIIINGLFFINDIRSITLNVSGKYSTSKLGKISSILANILIVVIFSFGVFFGIRFKKDWLDKEKGANFRDSFLPFITFQYIFGKVCLILFALLLKTYELYNIRSFFGIDL